MPVSTQFKIGLLSLLLFGCGQEASIPQFQKADIVFDNAAVYTLDPDIQWAKAVAIKDGRYIYVGNSQGVKNYIDDKTQLFDLAGKMIMPGINDAHIHPSLGGIKELYECNFSFTATPQQIAEQLSKCIDDNPNAAWIVGGQWDSGFFDRFDIASPRQFLDQVSTDKAIFLSDDTTHNGWVNSKALSLANIDKNTIDPEGGKFGRENNSAEPNGIILESASKLLSNSIPDWNDEQYQKAIKFVVKIAHQFGVTGLKDAGSPTKAMAAYQALDQRGKLNLHVATSIRAPDGHREVPINYDRIDRLRDQYKSTNVHTRFVKIFMDGVPTSSHTAAMLAPYKTKEGEETTRGSMHLTQELLSQDLIELDRRGYTVKIHTAGDRSVQVTLNAIEAARSTNGSSGLRHELSHAGYVDKKDIGRFAKLNAVADLSPYLWHPSPIIDSIISAIGQQRGQEYWPIKSLIAAQAPLLAGSDWPAAVTSMDPWVGIEAMITRQDPRTNTAKKLWPEQAINLKQALKIYTIDGANALTLGDTTGSIQVGKSADLILLNHNLFEIDPHQISETQIQMTLFAGQIVYQTSQ